MSRGELDAGDALSGTELPPLYQRSTTIALLRAAADNLRHDNAVNRFANDVADAEARRDRQWLHAARQALDSAEGYLARLRAVADDDAARQRAITDPRERDDIGRWMRGQEGGTPVVQTTAATTDPYRDAAITLWGEAGAYACDAYDRIRAACFPDLPARLPIVLGLVAYGHCIALTRGGWPAGPRISIFSPLFRAGRRKVDDTLVHEMLHASLMLAGADPRHKGEPWYAAVRRLSPLVLGHPVDARLPKSVRKRDGGRSVVRKEAVPGAPAHRLVAGWPGSFRPEGYDWGEPIDCPTY